MRFPGYVGRKQSGLLVLAKSAVSLTAPANDTNENILVTITLPPLGVNALVRCRTMWSGTAVANAKTARARFSAIGGTAYMGFNLSSLVSLTAETIFANAGATNSQKGYSTGIAANTGVFTSGLVTSAIDTGAATTLVLTAQKATGSETFTLEQYLVELLNP